MGRFNPNREKLEQYASEQNNVVLHCDVKDMAGLMTACQLAVTAGGTTIYELSVLGVPFVCFSYAENQEGLTEWLGKQEKPDMPANGITPRKRQEKLSAAGVGMPVRTGNCGREPMKRREF